MTAASKVVVDPDDPRSLIARHLTPDPAATLLTRHPTRCRGPRPTALSVQPVSGCIRSPKPMSHTIFSYGRPRPKSPFCSTLSPLCFQTGKKLCPSVGLQALTQPPRVHALMNNDTSRSIPRFMCRIFWVRGEGGKENIPHSQLARPNVAAAVPAVRPTRRPPSFTAAEARQGVPASATSARSLVTT